MIHATEEQLVLLYYGEAADRDELDAHLLACERCRTEYRSLQLVLNVMDGASVPERDADYGAWVWNRIRSQVPAGIRPRWFGWRRLAFGGALVTLLAAAFLAGRFWPQAAQQKPAVASNVRERVLLVALSDHLERSEIVLAELVNAPDARATDISFQRSAAEDLVAENRLLRATADTAGANTLAATLEELERVLLEIAHSPSEIGAERLAEIRGRVEAEGLLFKIRVLDAGVRTSEDEPAARDRERL
jgi:hypothetical protein